MTDERWHRLRDLFDRARDLPAAERSALLDRETAEDPRLRADVERLLASEGTADRFLAPRDTAPSAPAAGTIGAYHLLEILGEGGFGVVWLAEQQKPIHRRVALKLIKPGMDTAQIVARFEVERQALALMEHPGIAQVFEAGATETGRPYFVMEYVPGSPITKFCDAERLRIRERLALFAAVCDAVQHAHQKGVIHRDLKPSNVIVTRRDGAPSPKVIDFGVVKATTPGRGETLVTREGMIVGTLGYMSPEQSGAVAGAVDTRSDVYSLGVLLYELLTGVLPFDSDRLAESPLSEALRVVREEDPPPLATRLSRSAETLGAVAAARSCEARVLLRDLRGELEWIAGRALEKDPERRYGSAAELAADVRRYLADEPVLAAAPGSAYRLRKFVRKHRVMTTATALVLLAVVAGGVATVMGLRRAVRAERTAEREATSSKQVADFLVGLFGASNPDVAKGKDLTARTLLDEGTRRIESRTIEDPFVQARLLAAMSESYQNLGRFDESIRLAREALAATERAEPRPGAETARQLYNLAQALDAQGSDSVAVVLDRAIAVLQRSAKPDTRLLARCFYRKGSWWDDRGELAKADSILTRALRLAEAEAVPDTTALLRIYSTRATIAHQRFDLREAARLYSRTLQLAEGSDLTGWAIYAHRRLANVHRALGDAQNTQLHADQALRLARSVYPGAHPNLADALGGQADAFEIRKRYEEAITAREEAVRIRRAIGDPLSLTCDLTSLGALYRTADKPDLAIARSQEACDVGKKGLGLAHERTGEAMANLARTYAWAKRPRQADSTFRAAFAVFDSVRATSVFAPLAAMDYATLCRDQGRTQRADSFYVRAEAGMDSTKAALRMYLGACLVEHAYLRSMQGRHPEAEAMMRVGMPLRTAGTDDPDLGNPHLVWAAVRARAGDTEGAVKQLAEAASHGATPADVAKYAELTPLRARADYPLAAAR